MASFLVGAAGLLRARGMCVPELTHGGETQKCPQLRKLELAMDTMLVAVFENEQEASSAARALEDLHAEGAVFVYGLALIFRDSNNVLTVPATDSAAPMDPALGAATRHLSELIVARAANDFIPPVDSAITVARAGVDGHFIGEASGQLLLGRAAVVSEIEEDRASLIDTARVFKRGIVLRCVRREGADDRMGEELKAAYREVRTLEDELLQAPNESKPSLRLKLDLARAQRQAAKDLAQRHAECVKREAEAKLVSLQERAALAGGGTKERLEKLIDEVRGDYVNRAAKLNLAWRIVGGLFGAS